MKLPIDLQRWIEDHRELLRPPVGNKVIWEDGGFICMVVGGPNQRSDFHTEDGPEFFHQLEGEMVLRVREEHEIRDIPIRAGEVFLLPPGVPHSPQRAEGSIGLVIERRRLNGERDTVSWYCEECTALLYEEQFELVDIERQFREAIERFRSDHALHVCRDCGHVHTFGP